MDPAPGDAQRPVEGQAEPRQRWRVTYARREPASATSAGRAYVGLWEEAISASGLPALRQEPGRPRVVFAAPLAAGIAGRRELLDLWLAEPRTAWQVRTALAAVLPDGHELVDLENVWLGAPALPGRVVGGDYSVSLAGEATPGTVDALRTAAGRLLDADRLPRERAKGGGTKAYDLRPLLAGIRVESTSAQPVIRIRTVSHPDVGSGRPDEVLAALGDLLGRPVPVRVIVRERIVLAGDPEETEAAP